MRSLETEAVRKSLTGSDTRILLHVDISEICVRTFAVIQIFFFFFFAGTYMALRELFNCILIGLCKDYAVIWH